MNATTDSDTIVAVATPPGIGGIGVVRLSGPGAGRTAAALCGDLPPPRSARLRPFRSRDGAVIDRGLVLHMPAPGSYTGELMVELHAHGAPLVLDQLVEHALAAGARLARPGEFTERAFLNGRLDLSQAEAVADLIESQTRMTARAALRSLEGALSARVQALAGRIADLRAWVEATIDFPDEEIDFLAGSDLGVRLAGLAADSRALAAEAQRGLSLRQGLTVVLSGPPNAGKSSLLNRLAGRDRAIVSAIPGTTRDLIEQHVDVDGMPLTVVDTAGLRSAADEIESEGVRRALAAAAGADLVLLVIDDAGQPDGALAEARAALPAALPVLVVRNKIDLSGRPSGAIDDDDPPAVAISARTGAGLEDLRAALRGRAGLGDGFEPAFLARRRHLDALGRAIEALDRGLGQARAAHADLVAEELRGAQRSLGEITGEVTTEDILERIFSRFCIGK